MAERVFTLKMPFDDRRAMRWVRGVGGWRVYLSAALFRLAETVSRCRVTGLSYDEQAARTIKTRFLAPSRKG